MLTVKKQSGATYFSYKRLVPVLVLMAGLVVFFALGLERYLSFDTLREHRTTLRAWVETSGVLPPYCSWPFIPRLWPFPYPVRPY
jgi:hypothetical protein